MVIGDDGNLFHCDPKFYRIVLLIIKLILETQNLTDNVYVFPSCDFRITYVTVLSVVKEEFFVALGNGFLVNMCF